MERSWVVSERANNPLKVDNNKIQRIRLVIHSREKCIQVYSIPLQSDNVRSEQARVQLPRLVTAGDRRRETNRTCGRIRTHRGRIFAEHRAQHDDTLDVQHARRENA